MKRTRKIFALLLSICMIVTMLPTVAFAASNPITDITQYIDFDVATGKVKVNNSYASPTELKAVVNASDVTGTLTTKKDEWEKDSLTEVTVKSDLSISGEFVSLSDISLTKEDNDGKYIVVIDVSGGNVVAVGCKQVTGITRDIKVKEDISDVTLTSGTLSKGSYSGGNVLKYVILESDPSEKITTAKNEWSNETLTETNVLEAVKSLAGENTFKTLTDDIKFEYADNEKYVLVIELKDGHVQAYKSAQITGAKNKEAKLTNVTVTDAKEQPGTPGDGGTAGAPTQLTAKIPYAAAPEVKPEIKVTASGDAKIYHGQTADKAETEVQEGTISDVVTVKSGTDGVIYLKVVSQDEGTTVYYKLTISMEPASPSADIKSIVVTENGSEVEVKNTGTTFNNKEVLKSELPYNESEVTATVKVTATEGAKITYKDGVPEGENDFALAYPEAGISVPGVKVGTDKTIYIKVTSQDDNVSRFVELTISMKAASDDASISDIKIDQLGEYEVVLNTEEAKGKDGTTGANAIPYIVTVPAGTKATLNTATATFTVNKLANKVEYDASTDGATLNKTKSNSDFKDTGKITTEQVDLSTDPLYIKVTPEDEKNIKYYKITIEESEIAVDEVEKVEITAADLGNANVDPGDQEAVVAAVNETGFKDTVSKDYIKALAFDTASARDDAETWNDNAALLEKLKRVNPNADQAHVRVVAYLDVEVESYDSAEKTYAVDLTPKYYVAVATEAAGELNFEQGDSGNAYKLTPDENLPAIEKEVTVEVKLPTGMVDTGNGSVYVAHNNEVLSETTSVTDNKVDLTVEGFSLYEFSVNNPTVAIVGGTNYSRLQDAVDAAIESGTNITLGDGAAAKAPLTATAPAGTTFTITAGQSGVDVEDNVIITPEDPENYEVAIKLQADGSVKYMIVENDDGNGEGGTNSNHKVTVAEGITNGTVTVNPKDEVKKDTVVTVTVKPAEGYELDVLTIKTDGGAVPRDEGENGTYTFKMPAADVTVSATFKVIGTETDDTICKPYTDVNKDEWYHKYVHYMIENGLMTGTATNTFAPYTNLNRAMVAQILYAKANKPEDFTASKTFSDVEKGEWYTNAVLWAAANGAVDGYTDGTFKPLQDVTRQELAVMLYGIEKKPAITDGGELKAFTDAASVADWAQNAMLWAVQSDIMDGDNNKALNPTKTATRAEAAVMLYQYFE